MGKGERAKIADLIVAIGSVIPDEMPRSNVFAALAGVVAGYIEETEMSQFAKSAAVGMFAEDVATMLKAIQEKKQG